jgi:hypothetical protein
LQHSKISRQVKGVHLVSFGMGVKKRTNTLFYLLLFDLAGCEDKKHTQIIEDETIQERITRTYHPF